MSLETYYRCPRTGFDFDFIECNDTHSIYKASFGNSYHFYIIVTNDTKQFPYLSTNFSIPSLDRARRFIAKAKYKPKNK
jgi:hypothetical protein